MVELDTGKSFSEALILALVNSKHDKRLFIEFPEKYKFRTCWIRNFCFDFQNNICTKHVLNLYVSGNSMKKLSSYCWLTDSRWELLTQIHLYIWHSGHLIIIVKSQSPAEESDKTVWITYTTKKTCFSIFKMKMYFIIKHYNQFWIWHLYKK